MTNEARVLRALRLEHGLSLKRVGILIGSSASTIAHIETGRMNPPKGPTLKRFLEIYGNIKEKSFYERVRNFEGKLTQREELIQLINRATSEQVKTLLQVTKGLLS